ncbi:MAG: VanW family protein [Bacillota bacterium]|nr:VanW family protein [Bacillota bacterium]
MSEQSNNTITDKDNNLIKNENKSFDDGFIIEVRPEAEAVKKDDSTVVISEANDYIGFTDKANNEIMIENENQNTVSQKLTIQKKTTVLIAGLVLLMIIGIGGFFLLGKMGLSGDDKTSPKGGVNSAVSSTNPDDSVKVPDNAQTFVFPSKMSISNINIGGKTYKQAYDILIASENKLINPMSISVMYNGKTYFLNQNDFSYNFDTKNVLDQAFNDCRAAATSTSNSLLPKISNQYTIKCTMDMSSIGGAVKKIAKQIEIPVTEPRVVSFNTSAQNFNDKFRFSDGSPGLSIDKSKLTTDITNFINSGNKNGSVEVTASIAYPDLTLKDIKDNIVQLSSFTTTSTNNSEGNNNMRLALKACNGSIIAPGGVFSLNKCTGNSNDPSLGYESAHVISGGKLINGIGGGICEASATIYNAAIRANMGVVERHCHLWASQYVYAGLDATIDYPNLDLKLKNNTKYQIFIESYMVGNKTVCNIYGWKDPSFDEIRTISSTSNVDWSNECYDATAYRVFYKNGHEIRREKLPSSHYSLTNGLGVRTGDSGVAMSLITSGQVSTSPPTKAATQPVKKPATQPPTQKPTQPATKAPESTQPSTSSKTSN